MGWLRTAVGVGLLIAPGVPMRMAGTPTSGPVLLLMRTVGIRDLVLGLGTAVSVPSVGGGDPWLRATLASDALDVMVSLAAVRSIGRRDALTAAGLAAVFVCGDLSAQRGVRAVA